MDKPWLQIIGLTEDGLASLSDASRAAIAEAEVIFGGPRHLDLVKAGDRGRAWPIPFDIAPVLACRGRATVVLASGDPFWFGAGGSLAGHLAPSEWQAQPAPSTFAFAAARLGWRLEQTTTLGLHAAPFARMRPHLQNGGHLIALVRDGAAPKALADWLCASGFGTSDLWVMECLGGPRERIRQTTAEDFDLTDIAAPVAVAILARGRGLPRGFGLPDDLFASDGQITKSPIRAVTLSALAPKPDQVLWDLGAGSGSVSVEWCLNGGLAHSVEQHASRIENIRANAQAFGIDHRMTAHHGASLDILGALPKPDAVFIGGGANAHLTDALFAILPLGTRLVINTVTLETEALVTALHATKGGTLLRLDVAQAQPLGGFRGWSPARPVVQWSVTL